MASKKNKIVENVVPEPKEDENYNPFKPIVSYRGAETIVGGADTKHPLMTFSGTGGIKSNFVNAAYYKPATAKYTKDLGVFSEEALMDKDKMADLSKDISDMYVFANPYFAEDKRKNTIFAQIYNELTNIPGYIGQGALDIAVGAYDQILSMASTRTKEYEWENYISRFDENDQDVKSLYEALNISATQGKNPLYMDINKLKTADGKELSDKSKEIFQKYRELLFTRQDEAYRQKALEIFESMEPTKDAAKVMTLGAVGGWGLPAKVGGDYGGDKTTVGHMLTSLAARDVAGSVALAWGTGQVYRGVYALGKVATKLNKLNKIRKLSSAKVAARYASQILSSASVSGAEAVVASPIFLSQYNNIRSMALMQGMDYGTASMIGFIAGAAEGGLEFAGFKVFRRLYSRNGKLWNMFMSDVLPEALQESSQTIAENIITETTGLTDKTFSDIMSEVGLSLLAGGLGGGMFNSGIKQSASRLVAITDWSNSKLKNFSKEQIKAATDQVIEEKIQTLESDKQAKNEEPFKSPLDEGTSVPLPEISEDMAEMLKQNGTEEIEEEQQETEEVAQQPAQQQEQQVEQPQQEQIREEGTEAKKYNVEVTPELKQAVDEVYGQYFDLYKELALSKNKKLTEQQLRNGFKAVANNIALAREGVLEQSFNNSINNMVAYIPASNKSVKDNAKKINELLQQKGYSAKKAKEIQNKLLSPDWATKHQAQWEMAEDFVTEMFENAGLKEYAPQAFQTLKGLMFDVTFKSPDISITDILENERFNLINLKVSSLLYDQELPSNFQSILNKMTYNTNDASNIKNLVELLGNPKENALQINQTLYGENLDPDLSKTMSDINFLAGVEETVLNNSPFTAKKELISTDYVTMALMRKMGFTQGEIMFQFNLETSDSDAKQYPDEAYQDTLRRVYPEPEDIGRILKQFDNTGNEIQGLFTAVGNVNEETGEETSKQVGVTRGSGRTAVHEFQHYTLTNFMTRILESVNKGVLPKRTSNNVINSIVNLQNYLRRKMVSGNKSLTEAQFQETLIDAMNNYYQNKMNPDSELQSLIEKADEAYQKSVGTNIKDSIYKNIPEKERGKLDTTVAMLLENNTPAHLLLSANNLQDIALGKVDLKGKTPKEQIKELYNNIMDIFGRGYNPLNETFIPNADKYAAIAQLMADRGDFIGLMKVAMDVSNAAKLFSFNALFEAEKDANIKAKPLKGSNDPYTFFESVVLSYPSDSTIMEDAKGMLENVKNMSPEQRKELLKESAKTVKEKIIEGIKDVTQSISSAAYEVNNELGSMIEKEYYDLGLSLMEAKQEAAEFDKEIEKLKKDNVKYTEWVKSFSDAGLEQRKNAIKFLRNNVSAKAAQLQSKMWGRLDDIKTQLIGVGLSAELFFNDNYWPQSVRDYSGLCKYLGMPEIKAETTKLVDRLYFNAIRIEMEKRNIKPKEGETLYEVGERILSKEQKQKIYTDITNKVNGLFRQNISDSEKISSFFHRIILKKTTGMLQFYHDPLTSYIKYCEAAYRTILMRKLDGFVNDNTKGAETGKLGRLLTVLPRDTETQMAIQNFVNKWQKFRSVYKSDPNSVWNYIRQINNITTLGSFVNTINQTMDLVPYMSEFGVNNVYKAIQDVTKGTGIKIQDIGVESSSETFRTAVDNEFLKKAQRTVFEKTRFAKIDIFAKDVGINAAKNFFQESLKLDKSDPRYKDAMRYINECFPPNPYVDTTNPDVWEQEKIAALGTREAVIQDLKDGKNTYNTGFVLFHMLGKTQPINPSVTSLAAVAGGPMAKLCMQFTAPMLRQLEWVVDYFKKGIKTNGAKWAAAEIAKLVMFLIAIGLPKEIVTNAIRGRSTDINKAAILSPFHIIGVNEYVVGIMKRDGIFQGLASAYRPAFVPEVNLTKDLFNIVTGKDFKGNVVKNIPILGDAIYGWLLGGREQSQRMKNYLLGNPMDDIRRENKRTLEVLRS